MNILNINTIITFRTCIIQLFLFLKWIKINGLAEISNDKCMKKFMLVIYVKICYRKCQNWISVSISVLVSYFIYFTLFIYFFTIKFFQVITHEK